LQKVDKGSADLSHFGKRDREKTSDRFSPDFIMIGWRIADNPTVPLELDESYEQSCSIVNIP
jgi:hypothetical protein